MVCYQGNISIGATNENELKKKTNIILNRLINTGMTINEKICVNNNSKISFLGYTISKEGISPDQALIEKNTKNSYTYKYRLVNFYRWYIPKYIDLTELFANLKKNECWIYLVRETTKSFRQIKSNYGKETSSENFWFENGHYINHRCRQTFNIWNIITRRTSDNVLIKKTNEHWI